MDSPRPIAPLAPAEPLPLLLKPAQAAELLGIHRRALRTLTAKGAVAVVRIGRLPRYRPADLRRWLESKRRIDGAKQFVRVMKWLLGRRAE